MDFADALRTRRSCRNYLADPIAPVVLERVLGAAARAPSAGNTWALDLVVVTDPSRYWDVTLAPGPRRDRFAWPGLLHAPVLVIPVVDPTAYVARYAEADKAATGLGAGEPSWPVPYWWVDGGAATMAMLLAAAAEGLGSLLFGQFGHEAALAATFGIPDGRRAIGTVALGWPAPSDRPSRSATRGRPGLAAFLHDGQW